jgi:glycosyltransferase involved in cell wall biosynthesis
MELIITEKITPTDPTICLNMIVKNESHIIRGTLEKLCSKIEFSYWVICDTGSTDDTRELIIEFFKTKNIPGELYKDEWQNFAHNRTLALLRAFQKTDLLLVFDADDEIVGQPEMPKVGDILYDEYHLKFGSPVGTSYTRVLLVSNRKKFIYQSVIHEFICCIEPNGSTNTIIQGDYFVVSGRSGNRSLDPEKYLKDAKILEAAHAEAVLTKDPLFKRYAFYCANSYKDYGSFEEAIKWYKITLSQENWAQEHYISCLNIYECYQKLNQTEIGFFYLVKAFKYDPERVECLHPLLVHYCCEDQHRIAYNYYLNIKDFFENRYLNTNMDKKLFITNDKYNFFVPYYMILIADKVQDFVCVVKMFEIIFTKKIPISDIWYIKNFLYNLQFFIQHVKPENKVRFMTLTNEYIRFLYDLGIPLNTLDFLKDYDTRFDIDISYIFIKSMTDKKMVFSNEECKHSKNILFYTGFADVDWNYSYVKNNALGGSEKAVAYLSKELATFLSSTNVLYNVYVAGVVAPESFDNVTYIRLNDIPNLIQTVAFNTVICSRYISFLEMFKECSFDKFYIWGHDTLLLPYGCNLTDKQIISKWDKYITGCICQTEWHANLFKGLYPELTNKITIINNGIDVNQFLTINETQLLSEKQSNKFIYSSRPERGLDKLLELWPQILDFYPDAELVISNYGVQPEQTIMNTIKKYNSIKYLGKLNTEQLYSEMKTAEYWLYPTAWPETSCITALEMLMSEVICLYYPVAGLPFTIKDHGIQIASGNEIEKLIKLTRKGVHVIM